MLWPLVRRNESSPHESKGWVALIDGLSMPHAFIWAKKLLTSPIAGGWESEVNTLNLRFRAGCGTAELASEAFRCLLPTGSRKLTKKCLSEPYGRSREKETRCDLETTLIANRAAIRRAGDGSRRLGRGRSVKAVFTPNLAFFQDLAQLIPYELTHVQTPPRDCADSLPQAARKI